MSSSVCSDLEFDIVDDQSIRSSSTTPPTTPETAILKTAVIAEEQLPEAVESEKSSDLVQEIAVSENAGDQVFRSMSATRPTTPETAILKTAVIAEEQLPEAAESDKSSDLVQEIVVAEKAEVQGTPDLSTIQGAVVKTAAVPEEKLPETVESADSLSPVRDIDVAKKSDDQEIATVHETVVKAAADAEEKLPEAVKSTESLTSVIGASDDVENQSLTPDTTGAVLENVSAPNTTAASAPAQRPSTPTELVGTTGDGSPVVRENVVVFENQDFRLRFTGNIAYNFVRNNRSFHSRLDSELDLEVYPLDQSTINSTVSDEELKKNVKDLGCGRPRKVQKAMRSLIYKGKNVTVMAGGCGKTLGYAVPLLNLLLSQPDSLVGGPKVVVICPTRELTQQVCTIITALTHNLNISVLSSYGGDGKSLYIGKLLHEKCDIFVTTNKRLDDHMKNGHMYFDRLSTIVLEEIEQLVEYSETSLMMEEIRRQFRGSKPLQIVALATEESQKINEFEDSYMYRGRCRPARLSTAHPISSRITMTPLLVPGNLNKKMKIGEMLSEEKFLANDEKTMIIVSSDSEITDLLNFLIKRGVKMIEGYKSEFSQSAKDVILRNFRNGGLKTLIITDFLVRGLDIPQVSRVISADVPRNNTRAALVSRILRTGRTQSGEAFLIVNEPAGDGEFIPIIKDIFPRHQDVPTWMEGLQKKAEDDKKAKEAADRALQNRLVSDNNYSSRQCRSFH